MAKNETLDKSCFLKVQLILDLFFDMDCLQESSCSQQQAKAPTPVTSLCSTRDMLLNPSSPCPGRVKPGCEDCTCADHT